MLYKNQWLDKPSNNESFKQLQNELIILVEILYLFIKNLDMYSWFKYLFFVKCKSISTHLDLDNDNGTQQTFQFSIEQQNSTINECLLLSYEEALTCEDFASRFFYDYFAHMLSKLVNALVNLMEHTVNFFVEFPIPWESMFIIFL